jgi:hypothetical protein
LTGKVWGLVKDHTKEQQHFIFDVNWGKGIQAIIKLEGEMLILKDLYLSGKIQKRKENMILNNRIYDRIKIDGGQVMDTIEIVGEMPCKSQMLTGACEKKCLSKVWIDKHGNKYCPHPNGIMWIRKV